MKSEPDKVFTAKSLQAEGFAFLKSADSQTFTKQWALAKQTARMDAFRDLSAKMYREKLPSGDTVGVKVVRDESYRIYADMFMREAKSADYDAVLDRIKVTLILSLTQDFYRCMDGDTEVVAQCIQAMRKSTLTRLGSKTAKVETKNLSCQNNDCSDQLHVGGFSKEISPVDDALLDMGLYDSEWFVYTGGSLLIRYFGTKMLF